MKKEMTIWFDRNGNMVDYASPAVMLRSNSQISENFNDILRYQSIQQYRAPKIIFKSINSNRLYYMFLNDFADVLHMNRFINNEIAGLFEFVKKGRSQGIKVVWTSQEIEELKNKCAT